MWAFVIGLFGGSVYRNSRLPDSVKQQKWDARQQVKASRRRAAGQPAIGPAATRVIWVLLGVTLLAIVFLAIARSG